MSVRNAEAADVTEVAQLAALTFPLACPPGTEPRDISTFISNVLSVSNFENYIADPTRMVLVAEDPNGVIVGYALLVTGDPHDPEIRSLLSHSPTVEISKLYVTPTSHGGGVAAELMDAALQHASRIGCAGAWLGVNQENARAQKFYGKRGFEIVGTKTFVVGARTHDDFVLERALPDQPEIR